MASAPLLNTRAGVDTWSPCWRLRVDSHAARAVSAAATQPTARGRMFAESIEGHRIVWFEGAGLLAAEGHPDPEGLCPPDRLPDALETVTTALENAIECDLPREGRAFGFSDHGFAGIRRLDAAVNVTTPDRGTGLGLLMGLAAVQPNARLQASVHRQRGGTAIETVTWRGSRGIVARAYDKGVESLLAPRGRLVRLEDQRRYQGESRRQLEELDAATVRETWMKRFVPLWRATKGLKIVTITKLATQLQEAVDEGRCTPGQAVDVAGHLVMEAAGVRVGSRATQWRHGKRAAELGLVLVDGVLQEDELDVEAILEAAMCPAAWEDHTPDADDPPDWFVDQRREG